MKTAYDTLMSKAAQHSLPQVIRWGEDEKLDPAWHDTKKVLLLAIDVQNDFMEGGSLQVPGAKADVERLTRWMYSNMGSLTQVICSIDTHSLEQIFHACWWRSSEGRQPEPFTTITHADVLSGSWQPVTHKAETLEYLKNLEQQGKKQLVIWPYHCLEGSYGAQLTSEFTQMLYFHSAARKSTPVMVAKGQNPLTEMYGIIKAEYDTERYVNTTVLDAVREYDEVYIAGQAASHCVLASLEQIVEHYANKPEITQRITLLSDCCSPIVGFEDATKNAFEELKLKYGIRVIPSTNVTL